MKKTMTSLFLGLFIFSCTDLQDAAKSMKEINENQDLIINKLNGKLSVYSQKVYVFLVIFLNIGGTIDSLIFLTH